MSRKTEYRRLRELERLARRRRERRRRRLRLLAAVAIPVLAAAAVTGWLVWPESPEWEITSFDVEVTLTETGRAEVAETISYDFGADPAHGLTRTLPSSGEIDTFGWRDFGLTGVEARAHAGDLPVEVSAGEEEVRVQIGDFARDPVLTGVHVFEVSYTYTRLVFDAGDWVEYYADIVGEDWSVPIARTAVQIHAPASAFVPNLRHSVNAWCFAGEVGSTAECDTALTGSGVTAAELPLRYGHGRLEPGEAMSVRIAFPQVSTIAAAPQQPGEGPVPPSWPERHPVLFALLALGGLIGLPAAVVGTLEFYERRYLRKHGVLPPYRRGGGSGGARFGGAAVGGAGGGGGGGAGGGGGGGGGG